MCLGELCISKLEWVFENLLFLHCILDGLSKLINSFCICLIREFVKICYAALQVNSKIITTEQQEYQEVLRQNYHKLCQELSQLFCEPVWPDEELGSFKRNSQALFSAISGASANSSSA